MDKISIIPQEPISSKYSILHREKKNFNEKAGNLSMGFSLIGSSMSL